MRTLTIICSSLLLFVCSARSQRICIEVNSGLQGLRYKLENGDSKPQFGGRIGASYHQPLNKNWKLLSGIAGEFYSTRATLKNGVVFTSDEVDQVGSAFKYNVTPQDYEETQRFYAVGVPLKLQYEHEGKTRWYVNAGFRFIFPFMAKFKASAKEMTVSGYYPDYDIEVKSMPQHGFGTIANWKDEGTQVLNPALATSAGAGMSFMLTEKLQLYTGVYFDYGLTNMRSDNRQHPYLAEYNPTNVNNTQAAGVINISEARLLAYGVQFIIALPYD